MTLSVGDKVRVKAGVKGAGMLGVVEDLLTYRPLWPVLVRLTPSLALCYAEGELEVVAPDAPRSK